MLTRKQRNGRCLPEYSVSIRSEDLFSSAMQHSPDYRGTGPHHADRMDDSARDAEETTSKTKAERAQDNTTTGSV